jgi:hypothetical protein
MEVIPMPAEQDTLQEVFGLEREISSKLDAERQRADQWLEGARRDIEQGRLSEIARLKARTVQDEAAAQQAARDKAAEILRRATSAAARVAALETEQLVPIVRQHLAAIMPGSAT